MLTSSPVATASSSPRAFQYVTASSSRSPHQSPRNLAPLARRPSKSSSSLAHSPPRSSPQPRPKQYVAVDVATQYSPMEPFDPRVPLRAAEAPHPRVPPSESAAPLIPAPGAPQSAAPAPPAEPIIQPDGHEKHEPSPLSPSKRRKSPEPLADIHRPSSSAASTMVPVTPSQPSVTKRARTNQRTKALPLRYELCEVEDIVVLISNMLGELIETNDSIAKKGGSLTRFHSRTAPGISVLDYLHRLAKHATLTPPLLLSMVYYIDRLCVSYSDFTINTLTVHRFLITAATVAGKGLSDSFWNNSFYARVGGVKVAELKLLELEFLYRVDWKIVPDPEVLVAYYKALVERCAGYTLEDGNEAPGDDADVDESDDVEDEEGSNVSGTSITSEHDNETNPS